MVPAVATTESSDKALEYERWEYARGAPLSTEDLSNNSSKTTNDTRAPLSTEDLSNDSSKTTKDNNCRHVNNGDEAAELPLSGFIHVEKTGAQHNRGSRSVSVQVVSQSEPDYSAPPVIASSYNTRPGALNTVVDQNKLPFAQPVHQSNLEPNAQRPNHELSRRKSQGSLNSDSQVSDGASVVDTVDINLLRPDSKREDALHLDDELRAAEEAIRRETARAMRWL